MEFQIANMISVIKLNIPLNLQSLQQHLMVSGNIIAYSELSLTDGGSDILETITNGSRVEVEGRVDARRRRKISKKKTFRNQLLLETTDRKSIKIFRNGTIHFNAFQSLTPLLEVANEILQQVKSFLVFYDSFNLPNQINADNIEICAMNGTIKFPYLIARANMDQVSDMIEEKLMLESYYNEKHIRITYYFNYTNPRNDGQCYCTYSDDTIPTCGSKKRTGRGLGECISTTIFIYRTGTVRVFGLKSFYQLEVIQNYIKLNIKPLINEI
jgi:hypothetical protein